MFQSKNLQSESRFPSIRIPTVQIPIDTGNTNSVTIAWQNNLTEQINNMSVNVKFIGQALDQQSVNVKNGFYNSSDNSITFDKSKIPGLDTVNPSDQGNMTFDFSTLLPSSNPSIPFGNSGVRADMTVTGTPAGGDNTVQTLYSGETVLKISSALNLLSQGFRTTGPFENSGPFPPQVDSRRHIPSR